MYIPVFRDDVTVSNPIGAPAHINYCLTDESALELVGLLNNMGIPCAMFEDWPFHYTGGPFTQSSMVPWLNFGPSKVDEKDVTCIAGDIAQYWSINQLSQATALRYALIDIDNMMNGK